MVVGNIKASPIKVNGSNYQLKKKPLFCYHKGAMPLGSMPYHVYYTKYIKIKGWTCGTAPWFSRSNSSSVTIDLSKSKFYVLNQGLFSNFMVMFGENGYTVGIGQKVTVGKSPYSFTIERRTTNQILVTCNNPLSYVHSNQTLVPSLVFEFRSREEFVTVDNTSYLMVTSGPTTEELSADKCKKYITRLFINKNNMFIAKKPKFNTLIHFKAGEYKLPYYSDPNLQKLFHTGFHLSKTENLILQIEYYRQKGDRKYKTGWHRPGFGCSYEGFERDVPSPDKLRYQYTNFANKTYCRARLESYIGNRFGPYVYFRIFAGSNPSYEPIKIVFV